MRKQNISDLLDGLTAPDIEMKETQAVSAEHVKEIAMNKIHETRREPRRRVTRPALLLLAAALALSCAAFARIGWTGFARTGGLSEAEIGRLLDEASHGTASESVAPYGTTAYSNSAGEVVLTLSAGDAARYRAARIAAEEQAVRDSTDRIDPDTMELFPSGITEVPVSSDGRAADFALGNGHLALFCPEDGRAFELDAGASVTLSLDTDEPCTLEFHVFRDGAALTSENCRAAKRSFTFTAEEAGSYHFGVLYASAGVEAFQNVSLSFR